MLVLTFNPFSEYDEENDEALQRMLAEFRAYGHVVTGWRCATPDAKPGMECVLLQQGMPGQHVVFASGQVVSNPFSVDGVRRVAVLFERMVDPRRGNYIWNEEETRERIGGIGQRQSGLIVQATRAEKKIHPLILNSRHIFAKAPDCRSDSDLIRSRNQRLNH